MKTHNERIDDTTRVLRTIMRDDVSIIDIMLNDDNDHACCVIELHDVEYMITIIDVDDHSD